MQKGSVFLIPTYLSGHHEASFLAPMVLDVIKNTDYFLVENVRTARRFISSLKLGLDISTLEFEVLDKKSTPAEISQYMAPVIAGKDVGVISEAGLPGLADPGQLAVTFAHRNGLRVIPLPGASSIQTAVTSSGFSGQQFTFHGYLPIQKAERLKAIKNLEQQLSSTGYTQVFMETPFRNMSLISDLVDTLSHHVNLNIAADIFGQHEFIKTQTIAAWRKQKKDLHKIPSVFSIGHFS